MKTERASSKKYQTKVIWRERRRLGEKCSQSLEMELRELNKLLAAEK